MSLVLPVRRDPSALRVLEVSPARQAQMVLLAQLVRKVSKVLPVRLAVPLALQARRASKAHEVPKV